MKNQAISRPNPQQKGRKHPAESGSVIFLILIAVALFAALSYVIAQSSRTGMSTASSEQAKLMASEIIAYGDRLREGVKTLKINGCSDTQISFENSVIGGYENPSAPSDKKCHVFHTNGAGITLKETNPKAFANLIPNSRYEADAYGKPTFTGDFWVSGVGQDCTDGTCNELVVSFFDLKEDVCREINQLLGISKVPSEQIANRAYIAASDYFKGAYRHATAGTGNIVGNQDGNVLQGKYTGCLVRHDLGYTPGYYEFYQVLIAR